VILLVCHRHDNVRQVDMDLDRLRECGYLRCGGPGALRNLSGK